MPKWLSQLGAIFLFSYSLSSGQHISLQSDNYWSVSTEKKGLNASQSRENLILPWHTFQAVALPLSNMVSIEGQKILIWPEKSRIWYCNTVYMMWAFCDVGIPQWG